jgi:nucleoside phosphorylase
MDYPFPRGRKGHAMAAVVTILDEEFEAVRDAVGIVTELAGTPYFMREEVTPGSWDVILGQPTDRSNLPCGGFVSEIIEDFRPQVLLLVGIAGGLTSDGRRGREGLNLGDVVIADAISYLEFLKITPEGTYLRHYPIDHPSIHLRGAISQQIVRSFSLSSALQMAQVDADIVPKIRIGQIVSAEKVMSGVDHPVQVELLRPFDKALALDMESIGMARMVCERRTSFWYNPLYVVIRGISDLVGVEGNNATREQWKKYAAHTAALVAREFLSRFLKLPVREL